MLTCADGAIFWFSKQRSIVAQSFKESKFVALSFCVNYVLCWYKCNGDFKQFMDDAVVASLFEVVIREDNRDCLADVWSGGMSELSKHVDLKYQTVIEHDRSGEVRVKFVPSVEMVADVKNKNLSAQKFLPL